MALTHAQIVLLSRAINQTEEHELDCDEFVTHLAEWGERVLGGQSIDDATEAVRHHLSICPECAEEFRMLIDVLRENSDAALDVGSGRLAKTQQSGGHSAESRDKKRE